MNCERRLERSFTMEELDKGILKEVLKPEDYAANLPVTNYLSV
jgi:hypothetical protein